MSERELWVAIGELTEICDGLRAQNKELEQRISHLEQYAKLRKPTMFDGFADVFKGSVKGAMGE